MASLIGFDFVVGSSVDFQNGLATHTSIQSAINAATLGQSIFVRAGTYTEDITISSTVFLCGVGYNSYISGTLTITGAAARIRDLRINGNITLTAPSSNNLVDGYQTSSSTVTDSGTANLYIIQGT